MKNAGYEIVRTEYYARSGKAIFGIALGASKTAVANYVTWEFVLRNGNYSFCQGHYTNDLLKAFADFHERLADKIKAYGEEDFFKMFVYEMEE